MKKQSQPKEPIQYSHGNSTTHPFVLLVPEEQPKEKEMTTELGEKMSLWAGLCTCGDGFFG